MIHRDHRQANESSSAIGQMIHEDGPRELTVGDLDLYAVKYRGPLTLLRGLEHKNPGQAMGKMQAGVLTILDTLIQHAKVNPPSGLRLMDGSGVFVIRGALEEGDISKQPKFLGPQVVRRLDNSLVLGPASGKQIYDWLNGGEDWTSRGGRGRYGGNL